MILTGCSTIAQWAAPEKKPAKSDPEAWKTLDKKFWQAFHGGQYNQIEPLLNQFKAVYADHPNHSGISARIGFLHVWSLAERRRYRKIPSAILNDATLCRKFFSEASRLKPDDARFKGFWASCILAEADIHQREKDLRKGFFLMKEAIADWPQFNYFTAGYVLSGLSHKSDLYAEALDWQWKNIEVCADATIDRQYPNYKQFIADVPKTGEYRACWNSAIAPHNFEGFFLNMGDMLVKNGQPDVAKKIYATAKLAPNFDKWPFRKVLEHRIKNAEINQKYFQRSLKNQENPKHPVIMFESRFACTACHGKVP
jgi:tetratricopeptide (TPR) repeat protein